MTDDTSSGYKPKTYCLWPLPTANNDKSQPLTFEVLRPAVYKALGKAITYMANDPRAELMKSKYGKDSKLFTRDFMNQIRDAYTDGGLDGADIDKIFGLLGPLEFVPHFFDPTTNPIQFDVVIPDGVKTEADFPTTVSSPPASQPSETNNYDDYVMLLGARVFSACLR